MSVPGNPKGTADRWRRVEALYNEMRARAPEERTSALTEACSDDPTLAAEVLSLLDQPNSAAEFLNSPAMEVAARLASGASSSVTGRRIGVFEVQGLLGVGGMGEVYRARDTRLGRSVAIKILPRAFKDDPDRLVRFEREARVLASLNHPNIGAVYGLEDAGDFKALVLELVEGEDLSQRIARGAIPIDEALPIARQIAEAIEAAHEQGVIHRDLKPANIKLRIDGTVKVLDFGLAKAMERTSAAGEDPTESPTFTARATQAGMIIGTAGYMAPEQARGKTVDRRADVWSFGVVLYEMLSGRRLFRGETAAETLASVLKTDPEWTALPAGISPSVHRLMRHCLEKDPRRRIQAIGDARIAIEDALSGREEPVTAEGVEATVPLRRLVAPWIVAAMVGWAVALVLWAPWRKAPERRPLMRLNLAFSPEEAPVRASLPILTLSPDGTRLVYVGRAPDGGQRLYVRALDRYEVAALPGSEGGLNPFFSPDGQWVGFWADKKLKKVSLAGGRPLTLCDADVLRGASWGSDGNILFSPAGPAALWRVSENGGEPTQVTTLDPKRRETTHRWPQILPGGKAVIFTANDLSGNYDRAHIEVLRFDSGERRTLVEGGADARYLASGHLVFVRARSLFAVPFALDRLAVTGPAVPVLDAFFFHTASGFASYAVSSSGSLVYDPADPREFERELVFVDRKGAARPLTDARRIYHRLRISPDGGRVAVVSGVGEMDLWIYDLGRNTWDRLISGGQRSHPVWSNDGKRLAFCSNQDGLRDPYWMPIDHSAPPERLATTSTWACPAEWSPDGRTLILENQPPGTGFDIDTLELDGERRPRPFLRTPANEGDARLSPDGRWMAYQSDDSGRFEIYVLPYPGPGGRSRVSTDGGSTPTWSRDGRDLFFLSGGRLMAARVETRPTFRAGPPKPLFEAPGLIDYDVAPDGAGFILARSVRAGPFGPDAAPRPLSVVLGWFEDLNRRMQGSGK